MSAFLGGVSLSPAASAVGCTASAAQVAQQQQDALGLRTWVGVPSGFVHGSRSRTAAGSFASWAGALSASLAALSYGRNRRCLRLRAQKGEAEVPRADDLYVRVRCESVQEVSKRGAILGVRQMQDAGGLYHFPDLPMDIPILLDSTQTELFRESRRDPLWAKCALCEVRIHSHLAELFVTDECALPSSEDGLFSAEAPGAGQSVFKCQAGEAFAMAMQFQAPILMSSRYLLHVAKSAVDRLRVEQVCEGDEGCDVALDDLSSELQLSEQGPLSRARIGELIEKMKPFAWYWSEHRRGGAMKNALLGDFTERYQRLVAQPGDW